MATEIRKQNAPTDPAETPRSDEPDTTNQNKEGDYRNVETPADSPERFDDDYETRQENEISEEEVSTVNDGSNGRRKSN